MTDVSNTPAAIILAISTCFICATPSVLAGIQVGHIAGVWLCDEGDGDIAADASGNGHDGEIIGPAWVEDGPFGSALEFHGGEDMVRVEHSDDLSLQMFTIMAWVKTTTAGQAIIHKQPSSSLRNYILNIYSSSLPRASFSSGGARTDCDGTTPVDDDQWHHVAATYDQNSLKVYVDGELEGEISSPDKKIETNEEPLLFGHAGGTGDYRYTGLMDEIAVYNIALTGDEIRTCMEKGLAEALAVTPTGRLATTWGGMKEE